MNLAGITDFICDYVEKTLHRNEAWQAGALARASGLGREDCPYPRGNWLKSWWNQGWRAIDKALKEAGDEA